MSLIGNAFKTATNSVKAATRGLSRSDNSYVLPRFRQPSSPPPTTPPRSPGDGGGGYGYGGYGYGGSGSGSGSSKDKEWDEKPTKNQKAAAKNLAGVAKYNAGTVNKALQKQLGIYKTSDLQNKRLRNKNLRDVRTLSADDWFARQQQLQSATSAVTNKAGNALAGSGLKTLRRDVKRADDMGDAETLSNLRENMNTIYSDYYEATSATNNARNAALLEAYEALRNAESDYSAQLNNIHGSLYKAPGTSSKKSGGKKGGKKGSKRTGTSFGSNTFWKKNPMSSALKPQTQGFFR